MKNKLLEIYNRTLNNCVFYEKQGDKLHLLSEIGCLRGIAYCLEELGTCIHDDLFLHFIAISYNTLKSGEV